MLNILITSPAGGKGQWNQPAALTHDDMATVFDGATHVLLDWDGCVALADKPLPAAIAFMRAWAGRVAIVSNNSTHMPEDFVAILAAAGITLPASHVLLAGAEALHQARDSGAGRVMVLGDHRLKTYAKSLGLMVVREEADLVVLLRDKQFSYVKLARAANCLRRGARLIVANPDLTHPGANGCLVPETGALLAAILAGTDHASIDYDIIGKPSRGLFERACQVLGASPQTTVMIGDNPKTDGDGARAHGLRAVLIGPASGLSFRDFPGWSAEV
ncbi:Dihydroxyacetone phosphatase (plasmid) [Asticcacaulis sp. MM231]